MIPGVGCWQASDSWMPWELEGEENVEGAGTREDTMKSVEAVSHSQHDWDAMFPCKGLRMQPRAQCMRGKQPTTELHPSPLPLVSSVIPRDTASGLLMLSAQRRNLLCSLFSFLFNNSKHPCD